MAGPKGVLEVTAVCAKGLRKKQSFGIQDPYLVLRLGRGEARTRTHNDGGSDPVWNQTLRMSCAGEPTLYIEIKNDNLVADSFIGKVDVPLASLYQRGSMEGSYPVLSNSGKQHGFLTLRFEFQAAQPSSGAAGQGYPPPPGPFHPAAGLARPSNGSTSFDDPRRPGQAPPVVTLPGSTSAKGASLYAPSGTQPYIPPSGMPSYSQPATAASASQGSVQAGSSGDTTSPGYDPRHAPPRPSTGLYPGFAPTNAPAYSGSIASPLAYPPGPAVPTPSTFQYNGSPYSQSAAVGPQHGQASTGGQYGQPGQAAPSYGQFSTGVQPYGQSNTSIPPYGQAGTGGPPSSQSNTSVPPYGQFGTGGQPYGQSGCGVPPYGQSGTGHPPYSQSGADSWPAQGPQPQQEAQSHTPQAHLASANPWSPLGMSGAAQVAGCDWASSQAAAGGPQPQYLGPPTEDGRLARGTGQNTGPAGPSGPPSDGASPATDEPSSRGPTDGGQGKHVQVLPASVERGSGADRWGPAPPAGDSWQQSAYVDSIPSGNPSGKEGTVPVAAGSYASSATWTAADEKSPGGIPGANGQQGYDGPTLPRVNSSYKPTAPPPPADFRSLSTGSDSPDPQFSSTYSALSGPYQAQPGVPPQWAPADATGLESSFSRLSTGEAPGGAQGQQSSGESLDVSRASEPMRGFAYGGDVDTPKSGGSHPLPGEYQGYPGYPSQTGGGGPTSTQAPGAGYPPSSSPPTGPSSNPGEFQGYPGYPSQAGGGGPTSTQAPGAGYPPSSSPPTGPSSHPGEFQGYPGYPSQAGGGGPTSTQAPGAGYSPSSPPPTGPSSNPGEFQGYPGYPSQAGGGGPTSTQPPLSPSTGPSTNPYPDPFSAPSPSEPPPTGYDSSKFGDVYDRGPGHQNKTVQEQRQIGDPSDSSSLPPSAAANFAYGDARGGPQAGGSHPPTSSGTSAPALLPSGTASDTGSKETKLKSVFLGDEQSQSSATGNQPGTPSAFLNPSAGASQGGSAAASSTAHPQAGYYPAAQAQPTTGGDSSGAPPTPASPYGPSPYRSPSASQTTYPPPTQSAPASAYPYGPPTYPPSATPNPPGSQSLPSYPPGVSTAPATYPSTAYGQPSYHPPPPAYPSPSYGSSPYHTPSGPPGYPPTGSNAAPHGYPPQSQPPPPPPPPAGSYPPSGGVPVYYAGSEKGDTANYSPYSSYGTPPPPSGSGYTPDGYGGSTWQQQQQQPPQQQYPYPNQAAPSAQPAGGYGHWAAAFGGGSSAHVANPYPEYR